jgi:spermidine synthase
MYSAGTVNLYTREFFELCRDHLDQDGIMSLWIPGGWCMESDFRLILKTFSTVFNDYTLWHGVDGVGWYLIGSQSRIKVRPERLATLSANKAVRADISEYIPNLAFTPQILSWMFMCGKDDIDRYAIEEHRLLTDDRPYTEFPWLTWIGHGLSLKKEWMTLDRSLSRLTVSPQPGLFPTP